MRARQALLKVLLLIVFISASLTATAPAQADSCLTKVNTPDCAYGLPIATYNQLLPTIRAYGRPPYPGVNVEAGQIERYTDSRKGSEWTPSYFTGRVINGTPPVGFGWVLFSLRPSQLPGKANPAVPDPVGRYEPVFIYHSVEVNFGVWYLIGEGQWVPSYRMRFMRTPQRPAGVGGRWIGIDLAEQVLTAWENDTLVFTTLVSTGRGSYATPTGLTNIYRRNVETSMSWSMGSAGGYRVESVPYTQYFNGPVALHGAYWHDRFGDVKSHGCVNMSLSDAKWLYDWTESAPTASVLVWKSR